MSVEIQNDDYQDYVDKLYDAHDKTRGKNRPIPKRSLMIHHPWHNVRIGNEYPDVVRTIIEIPALSRVKTELDKPSGLLKVDRILHSSVIYPANYGFIPETLANDGDPLDVLVLCQLSIPPLSIIKARPIGVMPMIDQGEADDKIIAVAVNDPEFNIYYDISELPPFKLLMITQFFNDYKTLERKDVKTERPKDKDVARRIVEDAFKQYKAVYKTD